VRPPNESGHGHDGATRKAVVTALPVHAAGCGPDPRIAQGIAGIEGNRTHPPLPSGAIGAIGLPDLGVGESVHLALISDALQPVVLKNIAGRGGQATVVGAHQQQLPPARGCASPAPGLKTVGKVFFKIGRFLKGKKPLPDPWHQIPGSTGDSRSAPGGSRSSAPGIQFKRWRGASAARESGGARANRGTPCRLALEHPAAGPRLRVVLSASSIFQDI